MSSMTSDTPPPPDKLEIVSEDMNKIRELMPPGDLAKLAGQMDPPVTQEYLTELLNTSPTSIAGDRDKTMQIEKLLQLVEQDRPDRAKDIPNPVRREEEKRAEELSEEAIGMKTAEKAPEMPRELSRLAENAMNGIMAAIAGAKTWGGSKAGEAHVAQLCTGELSSGMHAAKGAPQKAAGQDGAARAMPTSVA